MSRLNDILNDYAAKNPVRFHMPGNKGKLNFGINISTDVTELAFTDNLYNPDADTGIIHELENKIAECFFPELTNIHSVISCGGATLCIQAAILSLLRINAYNGKYLICDRLSHISLINTLALLNVTPLWVYDTDIEKNIGDYSETYESEIIGVFMTSPDYYGIIKDINAISDICKKYSLPLIVDNSHGSHLAFHNNGELHPINKGADISIDSVHKTLPALTGAAILHTAKKFDKEMLRSSMRVFASTSPSFLILQSVEFMLEYLTAHGRDEHRILLDNINYFKNEAENIGFRFDYFSTEPYRIILNLNVDIGGKFLYEYLCLENIICEFYDAENVVIIPSVFNSDANFIALLDALKKFAGKYQFCSQPYAKAIKTIKANTVLNLSQVLKLPRKKILAADAAGKISAEAIAVYPPGVPIVLPGEAIAENNIGEIKQMREYIEVIDG